MVVKENEALKKRLEQAYNHAPVKQNFNPTKQQINYFKSQQQQYQQQQQQPKKRYFQNYIEDDNNTDIQYIVKKRRKPQKKIIYEDYVDGKSDKKLLRFKS